MKKRFKVNSRVLEQLGRELISSDFVALTELIKNSYDAYSEECNVYFYSKYEYIDKNSHPNLSVDILNLIKKSHKNKYILCIEDFGSGMTEEEIEEGFLTIGSTLKLEEKQNSSETHNKRTIQGEKGIGRLSCQRLGNCVLVETAKDNEISYLIIDWKKFYNLQEELSSIDLDVYNGGYSDRNYTRLWITDTLSDVSKYITDNRESQTTLFESFRDDNEKLLLNPELETDISFIQSPYKIDDGNRMSINIYYNQEVIPTDFKNEMLKLAELEYYFEVEDEKVNYGMQISPWYITNVHKRLISSKIVYDEYKLDSKSLVEFLKRHKGKFDQVTSFELNCKKFLEVNKLELENIHSILPIAVKVYSFKRKLELVSDAIKISRDLEIIKKDENKSYVSLNSKKMKPFLTHHNGIKLYRNGSKVGAIGNKDNDWLQLQQMRTSGQQYFRFDLGNTVGYVDVNDRNQEYIKDISSREGLISNEFSTELLSLLDYVFNTVFYSMTRDLYYSTVNLLKSEHLVPEDPEKELDKSIDTTKESFEKLKKQLDIHKKNIVNIKDKIKSGNEQEAINQLDEEYKLVDGISESLDGTKKIVENSKNMLEEVKAEKRRIKVETYNNFKLMANGIITEVMTHELHSLVTDNILNTNLSEKVDNVGKKLIEVGEIQFHKDTYRDLKTDINIIENKMVEMQNLYNFVEKTFLYKGDYNDFEVISLKDNIADFCLRLNKRLSKEGIKVDFSNVDLTLKVPIGIMVHILYNLIDNSISWINYRKKLAKKSSIYENDESKIVFATTENPKRLVIYDTGFGVMPEVESILFEPLVSRKEKGRGMGLYIVKMLLDSFGGDIYLGEELNDLDHRYKFIIDFEVRG